MKNLAAWIVMNLSIWPASFAVAHENNVPPAEFTALFNGTDIAGWTGAVTRDPREIAALSAADKDAWQSKMRQGIAEHWRVENGELVSDGNQPFLATSREFGDFELWVDWKIQPEGDSGIYLRGVPQVQIWDPTNVKDHKHGSDKGSGGLWNNRKHDRFPTQVADAPLGEWNRMHIRMLGENVTVVLNDHTVVDNVVLENYYDRARPVFMRGPIYLQTHGAETRFRNIFIRELATDDSNRLLAEIGGGEDGFQPLFNGDDLSGWMGATDDYEIVDGAIQCKNDRGGNLLTADRFANFVARLEFRLPAGGNNGLAIRVPGLNSDPAYDALELQVLDNEDTRYADLHDYQYHGSIYGLAPASRGYLRPTGQWNYEEIVVDGDRVEVHLNGFRILDANLAAIRDQPVDGKQHPGAFRTEGHFGFCGHKDPVAYRNIRIKRLP